MSQILVSLDPLFPEEAFVKDLFDKLQKNIDNKMLEIRPSLENKLRGKVLKAILSSEEYSSILKGELRVHFGLAAPQPVLDEIVNAVIKSVTVEYLKPKSVDSFGYIYVTLVPNNFYELTNLNAASYISVSARTGLQHKIPWLQWLLFSGDMIVLADAQIHTRKGFYKGSRTGEAIMVPSKRKLGLDDRGNFNVVEPGGWGVPSEFSGTVFDNWFTRIIDELDSELRVSVDEAVNSLIG